MFKPALREKEELESLQESSKGECVSQSGGRPNLEAALGAGVTAENHVRQARYRSRRKYPYNNTIQEESSHSSLTDFSDLGSLSRFSRMKQSGEHSRGSSKARLPGAREALRQMKGHSNEKSALELILVQPARLRRRNGRAKLRRAGVNLAQDSRGSLGSFYEPGNLELIPERPERSNRGKRHRKSRSDNLVNSRAVNLALGVVGSGGSKFFTSKKRSGLGQFRKVERISFGEYLEFKRGRALRAVLGKVESHLKPAWDRLLIFHRKTVILESLRRLSSLFSKRQRALSAESFGELKKPPKPAPNHFPAQNKEPGARGLSPAESSPVVNRIFHLLSRRFQKNNKYRDYFIDQIRLLTFRHRIDDQKLLGMIKSFDAAHFPLEPRPRRRWAQAGRLRHTARPKPLSRLAHSPLGPVAKGTARAMAQGLNRGEESRLVKLEHLMKLFRGDQLFGPVVKFVNRQLLHRQRNFLLNLRFTAKLKPFRVLHTVVNGKQRVLLKKALYTLLFHRRSHLKLMFLVFVVNRIRTRVLVSSFYQLKAQFERRARERSCQGTLKKRRAFPFTKSTSLSIEVRPRAPVGPRPKNLSTLEAFPVSSVKNKGSPKPSLSNARLAGLRSPQGRSAKSATSRISLENSIIGNYIRNFGHGSAIGIPRKAALASDAARRAKANPKLNRGSRSSGDAAPTNRRAKAGQSLRPAPHQEKSPNCGAGGALRLELQKPLFVLPGLKAGRAQN